MSNTAASPNHAGFTLHPSAPRGSKPIQYYSLATPNGKKTAIMLEELGLEYDEHLVDISKNVQFEEWFKASTA
jgi:GST-like protein